MVCCLSYSFIVVVPLYVFEYVYQGGLTTSITDKDPHRIHYQQGVGIGSGSGSGLGMGEEVEECVRDGMQPTVRLSTSKSRHGYYEVLELRITVSRWSHGGVIVTTQTHKQIGERKRKLQCNVSQTWR